MRRISTKAVVITGLLVALLLAGVVSYYASNSPDGLEHVAHQKGFATTAKPHHTDGSPLAGYSAKGVGNPRVSAGIAGVTGSLVVLVLAGGLAFGVRRRGQRGTTSDETASDETARKV